MILTPLHTAGIGGNLRNRMQIAAQSLNQSADRSVNFGKGKGDEERREDRVQLNPLRQAQSMIEYLMEQKQNLIEQKNQLIADTLAGGGDVGSVQALVSLYDEQISNIDTQISQTMKDMVEKQLEKEEEKKGKEPETKEEQQIRQMNELSSVSMEYEQLNQVYSAHEQKKREASILKSEIQMDGSRGGVSQGKTERLAEVLDEAEELYTEAMKGYVDLNVAMKEDEAENIQNRQQLESEEERTQAGEESLLSSVRDMADTDKSQEEETVVS